MSYFALLQKTSASQFSSPVIHIADFVIVRLGKWENLPADDPTNEWYTHNDR